MTQPTLQLNSLAAESAVRVALVVISLQRDKIVKYKCLARILVSLL